MQAVQGLLARIFSKSKESEEHSDNDLLSPTESEKNIILPLRNSMETPEGINDGPMMNEITNSSDESDSSMEILEVRSFTSDDELKILNGNFTHFKSSKLLGNIYNDTSKPIDDLNFQNNNLMDHDFPQLNTNNQNNDSGSFQVQPHSLDINRESQHGKESIVENMSSSDADEDNVIVELKNETQAMDNNELDNRGSTYGDDDDFINKIEESLINKHILQPVDNNGKVQEEYAPFEQMIAGNKGVTFEEENITSEEESVAVTDSNDKKENTIDEIDSEDDNGIATNNPSKNILEMIEETTETDTEDEENSYQMNIEATGKDFNESLKSVKYPIGSNEQTIEEPSDFLIQKVKTPYLDKAEIKLLVEEEKKGADQGTDVSDKEEPTTTMKRKVNDEESQKDTENEYSNPLLNGFFSQKKNKLKKRKVYIASEIKTFDSSLFTKEEDDLILEYVRSNSHLKNSHNLYDHIAKRLKNHTGNSIRRRFFNKLEKQMGYHYEVDEETGDVAKDKEGNVITTQEKINTQKSKYTAEEDYSTALLLKCHFYLDLNPDVEGIIDRYDIEALDSMERAYYEANLIPDGDNRLDEQKIIPSNPDIPCCNNGKVIDWKPDFAQFRCNGTSGPLKKIIVERLVLKFPNHSIKSWRDRYNRFLKPYGIDRYIYYYNKCRLLKVEPEPISGLTSARSRAILLQKTTTFAENITLADLEMKFTRRRA